ncbi:hypothetical protein [Streptomyces sp. E5N298]|uniref:hypothetical protein n=1 Tax=Streptomyces sp. E5N298 TaxID=1851983 RepID=UPI00187D1220|nr:hypothetical protein [Streptomyces sp. E5N298]
MRWGDFWRGKRAPLAVAAGSLLVAVVGGCSLAGEISDARRIDASPLRVDGVVDRVVQVKYGAHVRVSYQAGGQCFVTEDLPVGHTAGLTDPVVGSAVCLEASAEHPGTVRLCGQRYPGGDNMIPTEGLVVLAGAAGALMAAGWIVAVTRQERRERERSMRGTP